MLDSVLHSYSTWVHTLPPLTQPIVRAFVPALPVWLGIAVFERRWIAAHGPSPAKKVSGWLAVPVGAALFYCRDRYPDVRAVLAWPDRHIPGWHLHWWQMVIGVLAAAFVAKWLEAAFARIFLRQSQRGGPTGIGGVSGFPPGWEGWSRHINWHSESED